jgi:hypothetical protein
VVARQPHKVLCSEVSTKLLGQNLGIACADLKCQKRTDVSEHSFESGLLHLGKILIRNREIQPVFSSLREDCRE